MRGNKRLIAHLLIYSTLIDRLVITAMNDDSFASRHVSSFSKTPAYNRTELIYSKIPRE